MNFIEGIFQINGEASQEKIECNETYRSQHEAVMNQTTDSLCSLEEGMNRMRLIHLAEEAVKEEGWVIP